MFKDSIFNEEDLDLKRWVPLSKELEEYSRTSIEDIKKEYVKTIKTQEESFDLLRSENGILEYYGKTGHYLYELLYWESCKSKYVEFKKIEFFIKKYGIKSILDYGGGIGSLCIYLDKMLVHCDYLDVSGKTADFASWRFKRRGIKNKILEKPGDAGEAKAMLQELSGKWHRVISGVAIRKGAYYHEFNDITEVEFKTLSSGSIEYYVGKYKPFDKAGAYGIQEWIGLIGISQIRGSFYNVMGLPVDKVYEKLKML